MWRQSRQLTVPLLRSQKYRCFTHGPTNRNRKDVQDDKKMTNKSGQKDTIPPASSPPPRSSMSGLLSMIAERKRPPRMKKTRKDTSLSVAASLFMSADQTRPVNVRHQENASASPTLPSLSNQPAAGVSLSLVEKLRRNVHRKRVHWESMWNRSPSIRALPVWQQRADWCSLFLRSSTIPLVSTESPDALLENGEVYIFVCNAPTGSGKSSLVPLFLLDSHWQRLMQRIDATHPPPSTISSSSFSPFIEAQCNDPVDPFPTSSAAHYVQAFAASSRVCIVVSQPTRLACVELATFTAKLLAMADPTDSSRGGESERNGTPLVGGRVGYAVGGDVRYSPATEIIFATPGFIVNALHFDGVGGPTLSPTTLVIDETHCRDMETDLLLAWARRRLNEAVRPLRQLVLMSATVSAAHMMALFDNIARTKIPQELMVDVRRNNNNNNSNIYDNIDIGSGHDQNDHILETTQGRSFRVETYYLDELPDALHSSKLLRAWQSPERNASNLKKFKRTQIESLPLQCQLLSPLASRVMTSLMQFFSYTRHCPEIHVPQARAIAQFVLFTLQSLTAAPRQQRLLQQHHKKAATAEEKEEEEEEEEKKRWKQDPESILVFLPGFSEMSLVLQSLEQYCPPIASPMWKSLGASTAAGTALLQYEDCPFSVALLHATAIGSPQQQLRDTSVGPFRHRVILATSVAESSVTIPNVRCVIDSCLERRLRADSLTGVTLRTTALASGSSARQRAGRTGRTCDGIVFHLAPRRVFAQSESTDFGEATNLMAPLYSLPESVVVSPSTVLLRVKCLFPSGPSTLLRYMPSPPAPSAMSRGVRELSEMGLIELHADDEEHINKNCTPGVEHDVMHCYDRALLTAKGEFVAYLPIPYEQALLVYYALQFACVEEAVLLACAMTVPSLFVLPRVTASETEASAIQFSESITMQRKLAGFLHSGKDSNGKLSEPLMLLALLREWYACSTSSDIVSFLAANRVNRSAMRLVDSSIAQCAARIAHLLTSASAEQTDTVARADRDKAQARQQSVQEHSVGTRELHGEHDVTVLMPSDETITHLIAAAFPLAYRAMLRSSLLRLRRAALGRVAHRLAVKPTSVAQWYPHDDQLAPLLLRPPEAHLAHMAQAQPAGDVSVGKAQHRLCAAFVAAFARHTMRGEDAAHRAHHRRLLRNLSALHDDAAHTCSFGIDLHTAQRRALYERVTPAAVRKAIEPYVAGANMRQLELFATGRTAAVRFVDGDAETDEERSKADAEEEEKERERRLAPSVLPFEQQASTEEEGNPKETAEERGKENEGERRGKNMEIREGAGRTGASLSLAPFGISLLVAVQSSLSRLTLFLSPHVSPAAKLSDNTSQEAQELTGKNNSQPKEGETGQAPLVVTPPRAANGIRFRSAHVSGTAHENAADGSGDDICVVWHDNYGQEQALLRSAVQRAGYADLFPVPLPAQSDEMSARARAPIAQHAEKAFAKRRDEAEDTQATDSGADETDVLMSVQRINFTHALRWQVTLPLTRVPSSPEQQQQQQQQQQQLYCSVCHSAFPSAMALGAHCRSITHLSRLAMTVKLGMQRDWIAASTSATIDDLRERNGTTAQLHSCVIGSGSFLNALQWWSRLGSTTMFIAVAGALVANDLSSTSAIRHKDTSSPQLHAMHVWVLDGAAAPPSLFVIAGYLVAASVRFDAALLMNDDHSMTYAVMLHDWGVWSLPTPLTRGELRGVMEVFAGRPWRGAAGNAFGNVFGEKMAKPHAAKPSVESAGLHWCIVSNDCPQCTYSRSAECIVPTENAKRPKEENPKTMHSNAPSEDEITECALLLVLHEYRNSARSVFSLTDYTQRVVAKLNLWQRPGRSGSGGAEMIARLVARRRQQPLEAMLRDLGCQFITGESNEKLFLLPMALPSYLPAPDFAAILRRHRQLVRQRRVKEKGQVGQSQPLF